MSFFVKWYISSQYLRAHTLSNLSFNDDYVEVKLYDLTTQKFVHEFNRYCSAQRVSHTIALDYNHDYILSVILRNYLFGWGLHFRFSLK